jgi:DNA-binding beta-propeller fold protein YncE
MNDEPELQAAPEAIEVAAEEPADVAAEEELETASVAPAADNEDGPEATSDDAPDPATDDASEPAEDASEPAEDESEPAEDEGGAATGGGRRRARVLLVALLAALATMLVVFAGWYILVRKPISEFPLPLPNSEQMPAYDYSLYGVQRPMGIAVSPDGSRIYVTQSEGEQAVLEFDNRGNLTATMVAPDTGTDHVFVYVAIHPLTGDIYVSDRPAGALQVYSSDGTFLRTIDSPAGLDGWQPLGVAFSSDGHLLVTDAGTGQLYEFDPNGSLIRTVGQLGQFSFPNSVVVDPAGNLYVSDSNNGRLVVLDASGAQVAVLRRGPNEGDLGMPRGLAIDDQARVYVVDTTDQSVKVYRALGAAAGPPPFLGLFGSAGTGDGAFNFPNAVATDARGRVYVADWSNDRVQVWTY